MHRDNDTKKNKKRKSKNEKKKHTKNSTICIQCFKNSGSFSNRCMAEFIPFICFFLKSGTKANRSLIIFTLTTACNLKLLQLQTWRIQMVPLILERKKWIMRYIYFMMHKGILKTLHASSLHWYLKVCRTIKPWKRS